MKPLKVLQTITSNAGYYINDGVKTMLSKFILMMSKTQVKNQDSSKFQESKNTLFNQESRFKRRLKICKNFKKSIKINIKRFFKKKRLNSTILFKRIFQRKIFYQEFYSLVIDYQKALIDYH